MPRGIVDIANKLDDTERQEFIDLVRSADPESAHELEDLMQRPMAQAMHMAKAFNEGVTLGDDFLEGDTITDSVDMEAILPEADPLATSEDLSRGPSWQIDDYVVKGKISSGGQGTVFLAFQPHTERKVALKLLRQGNMPTEGYLTRFRTEYRSLALMDHQNVARIFHAGATPNGTPYFSMEYVEGGPIHVYCMDKKLPLRERLNLFLQVCEGVLHAHQKLVLHRDLKPANLLVCEQDGAPVVKIVDFGIAKEMNDTQVDDGLTQGILGTPAYIPPEFLGADKPQPDTRTDIYALGVVLYELLTNGTHLNIPKNVSVDEHWRQLREAVPEPPSRRLCNPCARGNRGLDLKDLDAIVLKALAREPERRYASVAALIDDCRHFLQGRAVLATHPGPFYMVRKFVAQHKMIVTSTALILLVLFGGLISTTIARREAERASARFQASYETLAEVFQAPDPYKMGRNARILDLLRFREESFEGDFSNDPELNAKMRLLWGRTYFELGDYQKAEVQLQRSYDLHRQHVELDNEAVEAGVLYARTLGRQGRFEEGEKLLLQLKDQLKDSGAMTDGRFSVLTELASNLHQQGKNSDAEPLLREARQYVSQISDKRARASFLSTLGNTYHGLARREEAEKLYRRGLELVDGTDDEGVRLSLISNLANNLRTQRKYEDAEKLYQELFATRKEKLGPDHHLTFIALRGIGLCYNSQGRYEDAEPIHRQAWEGMMRINPNLPDTFAAGRSLATALQGMGKHEESLVLLEQLLAQAKESGLEEAPRVLITASNLGNLQIQRGSYEAAHTLLLRTVDLMESTHGESNQNTLAAMVTLGEALNGLERYEEASTYFTRVIHLMETHRPQDPWLNYYRAIYGHHLTLRGQYEEAEQMLLACHEKDPSNKGFGGEIRNYLIKHYEARNLSQKAAQYR